MNTRTVNISFQRTLLSDIDRLARVESRSRSELLREAARIYIKRKKRWDRIFAHGATLASRRRLTEARVASEIQAHRRQKDKKR